MPSMIETLTESNNNLRQKIVELEQQIISMQSGGYVPKNVGMSPVQKKVDFGPVVKIPSSISKTVLRLYALGQVDEANKILDSLGISRFEDAGETQEERDKLNAYINADAFEKAGRYNDAMCLRYHYFCNAIHYWELDEKEVADLWKKEKEANGWI